jgi:hypothetical protein
VSLAYRFALENDLVRADAVEASEFPDLAAKYRVLAVPKTIVNDGGFIEGSLPEELFLEEVVRLVQPEAGQENATS